MTWQAIFALRPYALGVCIVLYAAVGFFGYAAVREHTSGNVINNFGGFHSTRTSFMHLFKLGYGCQVCASIPITLLPMRDNVLPFILPDAAMAQPGMVGRCRLTPGYPCLLSTLETTI